MAFHSVGDLRGAASTDGTVVQGLEEKACKKNDVFWGFSVFLSATFHGGHSAGYSIVKSASYRLDKTKIIFSGCLHIFSHFIQEASSCPLAAFKSLRKGTVTTQLMQPLA